MFELYKFLFLILKGAEAREKWKKTRKKEDEKMGK
jgi:hypothetical protein